VLERFQCWLRERAVSTWTATKLALICYKGKNSAGVPQLDYQTDTDAQQKCQDTYPGGTLLITAHLAGHRVPGNGLFGAERG